jgi:hypothetical protein
LAESTPSHMELRIIGGPSQLANTRWCLREAPLIDAGFDGPSAPREFLSLIVADKEK